MKKRRPWYAYIENGHLACKEPSLLLVIMYYLMHTENVIINKIMSIFITPYYVISLLLGINIPRSTIIGSGLRIYHYGCIIVNSKSVIGNNCKIRHGVTIGNRIADYDCPIIGDNCDIGAGAKILGSIHVGDNVTIGANAVVIKDIPDNCVAVGVPAKIIRKNEVQHSSTIKKKETFT